MSPAPLLITGFEPFGGEPVNPALEVLHGLVTDPPDTGAVSLVTAELPVDRLRVRPAIDALIEAHRPACVLALGQATGRAEVHIEARAVNRLRYGGATDNGGHREIDEPVAPGGPDSLSSTLSVAALAAELFARGLQVRASDDAGRYLCNALLYHLLHAHPSIPATFVHLPLLPEQARRRGQGEPAMALEHSADVVRALVSRVAALPGPGLDAP